MSPKHQPRVALNVAIGDRWLSAWQPVPGVTWVQTRSPQFARKLSRRSDGRLVAWGVADGFLRTFEFRHGMAWARRLINRYQSAEVVTNAQINLPTCPPTPQKSLDGVSL